MLNVDLTMVRGDTAVFEASLDDGASPPQPIDDALATYRLTVKRSADDLDPGLFTVAVLQTTPGHAFLTVQPASTAGLACPALLLYDIQVTESDGRVTTVATGRFTVVDDVSKGAP